MKKSNRKELEILIKFSTSLAVKVSKKGNIISKSRGQLEFVEFTIIGNEICLLLDGEFIGVPEEQTPDTFVALKPKAILSILRYKSLSRLIEIEQKYRRLLIEFNR
jgi:hypothetical protein